MLWTVATIIFNILLIAMIAFIIMAISAYISICTRNYRERKTAERGMGLFRIYFSKSKSELSDEEMLNSYLKYAIICFFSMVGVLAFTELIEHIIGYFS